MAKLIFRPISSALATGTISAAAIGAAVGVADVRVAGASAGQAGVTGVADGGPTAISLSLSATRTSGVAPMGLILSATATSPAARVESSYHDIEYVWSFDDPGDFDVLDNAPIWGTDRDVAYGPHTCHVFSEPGTYVVSCTAHDGTNPPQTETITITVDDPDTVFAGDSTAVVSTAGNFAGAPTGATTHTSLTAARNALAGKANQRLLLRRGETHTDTLVFTESSGTGKRILVGAFGDGADPKPFFDKTSSGLDDYIIFNVDEGVADELAVRDVDGESDFDPTSSNNPNLKPGGNGINFASTSIPLTAHKTVWGCHLKNIRNTSVSLDTGQDMRNAYLGNNFFDGWGNYGVLISDGGYIGFCGNKGLQPFGTRNGPGKEDEYADHGFLRVSRPTSPTVLTNNDISNYNEWTTGTDYTMQPVVRWNTQVNNMDLVIDRIRCEGGPLHAWNFTNGQNAEQQPNCRALIDRAYCVLTSHQNAEMRHGGTTIRNAIYVIPNKLSGGGTGIQGAGLLKDNTNAQADRCEFYSNACIDLRNDANSRRRDQTGNYRDFAFPTLDQPQHYHGNNLGYAPNRGGNSTGFTAHNPLDTSDGAWDSGFAGEAYEAQSLVTSNRIYGRDQLATWKPLTGSAAIGGATGKVSLIDFEGNLRSTVLAGLSRSDPSIGPYEPDLAS